MYRKIFTDFNISIIAVLLLVGLNTSVSGQVRVVNYGTLITVNKDSVYINGSYNNYSDDDAVTAGTFYGVNQGKVIVTDSVFNNNTPRGYTIPQSQSMIYEETNFIFRGNRSQKITGITPIQFYKLILDKSADSVKLYRKISVTDTLSIIRGNIHLNHDTLYLNWESGVDGGSGTIVNERFDNRISDYRDGRGLIYSKVYNPEFNKDFLGIGLTFVSPVDALGETEIIRGHGKQGGPPINSGPGDGSILRYYQVKPGNPLDLSFDFSYFENELDGHPEDELNAWSSQSENDGVPGGLWTQEEEGSLDIAGNRFVGSELLMKYTRFSLAPRTCTNPPVVPFPSDTVYLCTGADTVLDAGNKDSYFQWRVNEDPVVIETTQKITVEEEGNYKVWVKDTKGCVTVDSVRVIIVNNPTSEINDVIPVCRGTSSVLISNSVPNEPGGLTYLWQLGDADNSTSTMKDTVFEYKEAGAFTVTLEVTNQYGCKNQITEVAHVNPVPVADFTVTEACEGIETVFTNQSTIPFGGMIHSWNFGDGNSSTLTDPTHLYAGTGDFTVTLTSTYDLNSMCTHSVSQTFSIYPSPIADFAISGNCEDDPVAFTNASTVPAGSLSYQWSFDDGTSSLATNPVKTFTSPGVYDVRLIAISSQGCRDTIIKNAAINNCSVDCSVLGPAVNLGVDRHLCDGEEESFDAGNPGCTYEWSNGSSDRVVTVNSQGVYEVEVISPEGCVAFDDVEVTVTPRFFINLGADKVLCNQDSGIELSPSISRPGTYAYAWGSDQGISGNSSLLEVASPGKYWVTVSETSLCGFFDRDTIEISATTNTITAEFLVASNITVGDALLFVQLSHPDPVNFLWTFGDNGVSTEKQPVHTYMVAGEYAVQLIVDNGVCSDTLTKYVDVINPKADPVVDPPVDTSVTFVELPEPSIYPNPTEGEFTYELKLEAEADVTIQIYTMEGQMIDIREIKGDIIKQDFDLRGERGSLFLIRTIVKDQFVVKRLIKL